MTKYGLAGPGWGGPAKGAGSTRPLRLFKKGEPNPGYPGNWPMTARRAARDAARAAEDERVMDVMLGKARGEV